MYAEATAPEPEILRGSPEIFSVMLDEASEWAKRSGLREEDISEIIKAVRRKRRA